MWKESNQLIDLIFPLLAPTLSLRGSNHRIMLPSFFPLVNFQVQVPSRNNQARETQRDFTCPSHVISVFNDYKRGGFYLGAGWANTHLAQIPSPDSWDDLPARCSVFSVHEWECSKNPSSSVSRSPHCSRLITTCEKVRKRNALDSFIIDSSAFTEFVLKDGRSMACNWKSCRSLVLYRQTDLEQM